MGKEAIVNKVAQRMKLIYKGALEQFERHFPDQTHDPRWSVVRNTILNIGNDQIRLLESDFSNFEIRKSFSVHKPSDQLLVHADKRVMRLLCRTSFSFTENEEPMVRICADSPDDRSMLYIIRDEVGAGVVDDLSDDFVYYIRGVDNCIDKIIPIFDRLTFITEINNAYQDWKNKVIDIYLGAWNG